MLSNKHIRADFKDVSKCNCAALQKQECRAIAKKPRDAAAILFGLKFADTFITSLRVAKLRKPGFTATNIPAQNRI